MKSLPALSLHSLIIGAVIAFSVGCQRAGPYEGRVVRTEGLRSAQRSVTAVSDLDLEVGMQMKALSRRGIVGCWYGHCGGSSANRATFCFMGDGRFTELRAGSVFRTGTYTADTGTTPAYVNISLGTGAMLYASAWWDGSGRLRMSKFFRSEAERNSNHYLEQETYILETAPAQNPVLISGTPPKHYLERETHTLETARVQNPVLTGIPSRHYLEQETHTLETARVQSSVLTRTPSKPLAFDWNGTHHGKPVGLSFNGDIGFTMMRDGNVMRGHYLKDAFATPHTLLLTDQNEKQHPMYYRLEHDKLILADGSDEKFADPITLQKRSHASRKP